MSDDHNAESLETVIARQVHKGWCDRPNHSWGNVDWDEAVALAAVVRAFVAAGGVL